MGNKLRSPTYIGSLKLSDGSIDNTLYVDDAPLISPDLNIGNGTGDYSLLQKETSAHQGQATGRGSIIFGGFRGDKPNNTPNPIPNDDASVNNLDQDAYNDTVSKVTGIQSVVFGAGNRAYGNWSFIMGKDSKTCSRAAYIFGGKNYVGNPNNGNIYLHSMAIGSLNTINSTNSFAAGTENTITNSNGGMALGKDNSIEGNFGFALGDQNVISADYGGAIGTNNDVFNVYGRAIGTSNKVSGNFSIAIGSGLSTSYAFQTAFGKHNAPMSSDILLALGNGSGTSGAADEKSTAFEITNAGIVRAYGTPSGSNDLIPKGYADANYKLTFDSTPTAGSTNPVTSEGIKTAIDNAIVAVYKPQGKSSVSALNGLTKTASMNGYVYDMTDSGTLTNYDGTTESVKAKDNVVFLWNDGDWYWDNFGEVVDLSGYVQKTTEIAGLQINSGISASALLNELFIVTAVTIEE